MTPSQLMVSTAATVEKKDGPIGFPTAAYASFKNSWKTKLLKYLNNGKVI